SSRSLLVLHVKHSRVSIIEQSSLSCPAGPCWFSMVNTAVLKPRSPGDLNFQWREEAVTVTCSNLGYNDLQYEIQHKTIFDSEWQSTEAETCNVTINGLDAEKCYSFRARVKALEFAYGSETYPSDWSEVTHQQSGVLRDSCWENSFFPKFILIAGMVSFLTVFLLLLSLWKLHRIKKVLMPSVPDPKFSFLGLFESHQGNFQVSSISLCELALGGPNVTPL
ncbi:hypothetical protein FD755_025253, partial [Muntiacus reevesi]